MRRYPSSTYLLGAMLTDDIEQSQAFKIADGYVQARADLDEAQLHVWLTALLGQLGTKYGQTALTILAQPSDHAAPHYEHAARESGWKEHHASTQDA